MRVLIDQSSRAFIHGQVEVWVIDGRDMVLQMIDGAPTWIRQEAPEGAARSETFTFEGREHRWAPTLVLPQDVATEVAAAVLDVAPASREQGEALRDTRAVRDRLLALVEKVVTTS